MRTHVVTSRQKNAIVLKEAREARLWLRLIVACDLAPADEAKPLYDEANQLVGIFTAGAKKLWLSGCAPRPNIS